MYLKMVPSRFAQVRLQEIAIHRVIYKGVKINIIVLFY